MPIEYKLDRAGRFISTWCRGATTLKEVVQHFDELEGLEPGLDALDVLLDLTEQTSLPTSDQIRAAAERAGKASERLHFRVCAIVVGRDALFGMIRMFEVFAERHFAATRIFRDRDAAIEWLAYNRARLRSGAASPSADRLPG